MRFEILPVLLFYVLPRDIEIYPIQHSYVWKDRKGMVDETIQLVDETLGLWTGGNKPYVEALPTWMVSGNKDETEFARLDTQRMICVAEELQLIVQLLRLKGKALMKLHGPGPGDELVANCQSQHSSINIFREHSV